MIPTGAGRLGKTGERKDRESEELVARGEVGVDLYPLAAAIRTAFKAIVLTEANREIASETNVENLPRREVPVDVDPSRRPARTRRWTEQGLERVVNLAALVVAVGVDDDGPPDGLLLSAES